MANRLGLHAELATSSFGDGVKDPAEERLIV